MKLEVGRCYKLTRNETEIFFRVVKYLKSPEKIEVYIKLFYTGQEEELFTQTLAGNVEDLEITEIECME